MSALLCARTPADQVDYANERFIVCKIIGVTAYGRKFEMGDELPKGILNARQMREIYDTPTRLIETMDYALADEELLARMMARSPVALEEDEEEPEDDEEDADGDITASSTPPVVSEIHTPDHRAISKRQARKPSRKT
jgi:hypothetical protein